MTTMQPRMLVNVADDQQWKRELSEAISSLPELFSLLRLEHLLDSYPPVSKGFRLRVPRAYVDKMQLGNIHDPLLRQVLPSPEENNMSGLMDPVGDLGAVTTPGLLHKYHGRVLLLTTGACAIHCRYCFRRHFPYSDNCKPAAHWQDALDYIAANNSIQEVILSGGDPLTMDDQRLAELCEQLQAIEHVKWLRIHTRLPVVLPSRINASLLKWISGTRLRTTMVIHANHANELGDRELNVLQQLRQADVSLLNQSVLLKRVNDDADSLAQLSRRLHDCGVMPYYLHLLDPVQGAMHFDVDQSTGCQLIESLRSQLPGYLVPRLVREEIGNDTKTAIFSG